jgi:hypothetical protein
MCYVYSTNHGARKVTEHGSREEEDIEGQTQVCPIGCRPGQVTFCIQPWSSLLLVYDAFRMFHGHPITTTRKPLLTLPIPYVPPAGRKDLTCRANLFHFFTLGAIGATDVCGPAKVLVSTASLPRDHAWKLRNPSIVDSFISLDANLLCNVMLSNLFYDQLSLTEQSRPGCFPPNANMVQALILPVSRKDDGFVHRF